MKRVSGERPMGAASLRQQFTEASCQPHPTPTARNGVGVEGGGGARGGYGGDLLAGYGKGGMYGGVMGIEVSNNDVYLCTW